MGITRGTWQEVLTLLLYYIYEYYMGYVHINLAYHNFCVFTMRATCLLLGQLDKNMNKLQALKHPSWLQILY